MQRKTLYAVISLAMARLFLNMTRRFVYPFIPEISRSLGVERVLVENVVAVQAGIGVASPAFGPLSERYGRRRMMLIALGLMGLAAVPAILQVNFGIFYAVMLTFGIAKIIYDPAMQAYISDRVDYRQRGIAIGITELSWAGSLILVAPLTGLLLKQWDLNAVFGMLFAAAVIAFLLVWWIVPPDEAADVPRKFVTPRMIWVVMRSRPMALAALIFSLLLVAANEAILIVYGVWMETTFDLELVALGTATLVIAAAEVLGEFSVIGMADRFGKRRLAMIGALLVSLGYAVLPILSFSLTAALFGLFFIFYFIEIAIVSSITLFTEVLPEARAVMMSSNFAAHSIGRFSGAVLGGLIYAAGDFQVNGLVAMGFTLLAAFVLWRFIQDH